MCVILHHLFSCVWNPAYICLIRDFRLKIDISRSGGTFRCTDMYIRPFTFFGGLGPMHIYIWSSQWIHPFMTEPRMAIAVRVNKIGGKFPCTDPPIVQPTFAMEAWFPWKLKRRSRQTSYIFILSWRTIPWTDEAGNDAAVHHVNNNF